jgi:DNA-binding transcriptional LysR family regulator
MHGMHIEDLDLTQIRLLAELSNLPVVSAAAQRIGLSQSAASHALAKLRKQLGDPLFTRTAGGFRPTPYGERLGTAAREALDLLVAGISSNRPFDPRATTRLFNFYMNDVGQMVLLPRLLERLKKDAPGARVRVLSIPLENPGTALGAGNVDVAVGFFDNLTTGFIQALLFREHYVCMVRTSHPGFHSGMTLEAFTHAEHAIADATGMAHAVIDRFLAKNKIRRNVALRVPGLQVLPMIIANSSLLAIVPSRLAQAFALHGRIKVLPMPVPIPSFDIRMFWHERYHHDPTIRWIKAVLVDLFHTKHDAMKKRGRKE